MEKLTGVNGSCLDVLRAACSSKSFDQKDSVNELTKSVEAFDNWLNQRTNITLWLPTLNINAKIEVPRLDILFITGNQSKHNLSRLTGVSKQIHRILEAHSYSVPFESIPLSLEDFQEHLEENYFIYYGTWLSEFLNNLRWGIQIYLKPTFDSSYKSKPLGEMGYTYEYPAEIQHDIAKEWYRRLMNNIRTGPYIKKFVAAHYLKDRSSIE